MCGILFAKLRDGNSQFRKIFSNALLLMAYRGKDNQSVHQELNNYFGHVRLSILDLSSRSNQPVLTKNHVLLFKGEIYNYKELVPNAVSDTLALASMLENGINITDKLYGMYAVLYYQKNTHDIFIQRDFYGEKPLYYYCDEHIFIASSTIKPILYILKQTFNISLNLNNYSLYEFLLSGYVREPKTIYEKINMLNSGHILHFSDAKWEYRLHNHFPQLLSKQQTCPKLYAKNCLQTSDVKPGLLLSSGVDSTYLLSLIHQVRPDYEVMTYKAHLAQFDESVLASKNLKKISKDKELKVIENHQDPFLLYEEYPTLLEQPSSDGVNLFNILLLSKKVDPSLKLIILGTGGDELYGGYHSFRNFNKVNLARKFLYLQYFLPHKYKRFFFNLPPEHSIASYYFLYRICPFFLSYVPKQVVERLFLDFVADMNQLGFSSEANPYQKIKHFETFDYMRNQLLRDADNISLYCGYEARNPLLAIGAYHIVPDGKKAMKDLLKKDYGIIFGKKRGFTLCDQDYIKHVLREKILYLNKTFNILSHNWTDRLVRSNSTNFYVIRKLYIFFAWLQCNIKPSQLNGFCL